MFVANENHSLWTGVAEVNPQPDSTKIATLFAGHINCLYFHEPIEKPQWKGDLIYHWGEFARQNELAKVIVQKAKYVYMDVDTMLSLRPDQHMKPPFDCLHYAIPGPLDIVFHLFYNILLLLQ